jgi:hypothetical protein
MSYTAAEVAAEIEGWAAEAQLWNAKAHELRLTAERLCRWAGERLDEANTANDKADEAQAQVRLWRAIADGAP